mgnify:CR=1 FL=1
MIMITEIEKTVLTGVSKLALLTNAGMILREAWQEVAQGGEGTIYKEMRLAVDEMNNGVADIDAIYNFVPLFVDALPSGAGVYYNAYKNNTADGTIYDFTNETNISSVFSSWNGGAYCTVSLISDAKYVRYEKSKEYTSNIQRALSFTAADSSTDTTVVEMDMRIGGITAGTSFFSVITVHNRGYARDIYLSCDKNGRIQFRNSDNYEKAEGYAGLNADEWYNVRIVISSEQNAIATESGVAEIYINNKFACKTVLYGKNTSSNSTLLMQLRSASEVGTYVEFDNVFVGHIANN